jgi:hypothetical protein
MCVRAERLETRDLRLEEAIARAALGDRQEASRTRGAKGPTPDSPGRSPGNRGPRDRHQGPKGRNSRRCTHDSRSSAGPLGLETKCNSLADPGLRPGLSSKGPLALCEPSRARELYTCLRSPRDRRAAQTSSAGASPSQSPEFRLETGGWRLEDEEPRAYGAAIASSAGASPSQSPEFRLETGGWRLEDEEVASGQWLVASNPPAKPGAERSWSLPTAYSLAIGARRKQARREPRPPDPRSPIPDPLSFLPQPLAPSP